MNTARMLVLLIGDTVSFFLALALMIAFDTHSFPTKEAQALYLHAFTIPFAFTLVLFYITNLYDTRKLIPTPRSLGRFAITILLVGASIGLFFYLFPSYGVTPKLNLIIFSAGLFILLVLWRRFFFFIFSGSIAPRIVFVGETPEVETLTQALREHPHIGHVVGKVASLENYDSDTLPADTLIIAREEGTRDLARLVTTQTPIVTIQHAYEDMFGKTPLSLLSQEEAFALVERKGWTGLGIFSRLVEILIASIVFVILSPFLLLALIGIFLEDGRPVIYSQTRVGKGGKEFRIYKLRTMEKDAEKGGAQWADKRDKRVTHVGRVLRILHLDEIPQMWNIIRGDIALVGPRPERPEFVQTLEKEIPYYFIRHTIKPGFTGWAQIKYSYARTLDDSREKFSYDLYYLKNRSPLLDLGILAKTIQIIFSH